MQTVGHRLVPVRKIPRLLDQFESLEERDRAEDRAVGAAAVLCQPLNRGARHDQQGGDDLRRY